MSDINKVFLYENDIGCFRGYEIIIAKDRQEANLVWARGECDKTVSDSVALEHYEEKKKDLSVKEIDLERAGVVYIAEVQLQ